MDDVVVAIAGTPVEVDVLANDEPGRSIRSWRYPEHGTVIHLSGGRFRYVPPQSYYGTDHWEYQTDDGEWHRVWVSVLMPGGRPPVARVFEIEMEPDETVIEFDPTTAAEDPEGGPLELVGVSLPDRGNLTYLGDNRLRYESDGGGGVVTFSYVVRDIEGRVASGLVRIKVGEALPPPQPENPEYTIKAGETLEVPIRDLAHDHDGGDVELVGVYMPQAGTVRVDGDRLVYQAPDAAGEFEIAYTVRGDGGYAQGKIRVTVAKVQEPSNPPPPPPPPASPPPVAVDEEFPAAAGRELVVRNGGELKSALQQVNPGDHIILEDGDYKGFWQIVRSGEPGKPIVIRARNLLGARVGLGIRGFEFAASHIFVWGIDFKDCLWMPINGRDITIRRCRIWPLYSPKGAIALVPQNCQDVRIDYCTLRLYTTAEVQAMGAKKLSNGSYWQDGANYGCIWCYTDTKDFKAGKYPRNMVVERCRFEGGPSGVPYNSPNCQFVEWGGNPKTTALWDDARDRPLYDENNVIRLCYGNVDRDLTIIDIKGAGCVLDRVHVTSKAGSGSIQIRSGSGHRVVGCRFEGGVYMSVQGRGHYIDNVVGSVLIMAGDALWDLSDADRLGAWGAAYDVEVYRVAGVKIGHWWSGMGTPKHKAKDITYGDCPGAVLEHVENAQEVAPPPATVDVVTLDATMVGHDAGWTGVEEGADPPEPPPPPPPPPPAPPPPPPPSIGTELPEPLREVHVSSVSALNHAIDTAQPGDHIILADGVYGGPIYIKKDVVGTAANPIVIRARNLLKAKIKNGIRIEAKGCEHLWFWGLNVYGVSWVRGENLKVRRCRFESDYVPLKSTASFYVLEPSNIVQIDYCHFHQWTLEDYKRHTGKDFEPPDGYTHYTALKISGYKSDPMLSPRNVTVHRCFFDGGFPGGKYYRPSHMLFLASDTGKATLDPRWRGIINSTVRLCRFVSYRTTGPCVYTKASGTVFDRIHVTAENGRTFISIPRHGYDIVAKGCRFEGGIMSIKSGQHKYINCLFGTANLYSGTIAWNEVTRPGIKYWNATYRCKFYNCHGNVNVGTNPDWPHPSRECEFHNHNGSINLKHEVGTIIDPNQDPAYPVADPITIDPAEVGPYAEWRGETD